MPPNPLVDVVEGSGGGYDEEAVGGDAAEIPFSRHFCGEKRGEMKRGALVIACGEAGLAVIVKEHDFPSNPISSTFGSPRVFGTWAMLAMAL